GCGGANSCSRNRLAWSAMDAALPRLSETGCAAWPAVPLEEAAFAAHVRATLAPDAGAAQVSGLDAGGLYLACACARGLPSALAGLDRHALPRAPECTCRIP